MSAPLPKPEAPFARAAGLLRAARERGRGPEVGDAEGGETKGAETKGAETKPRSLKEKRPKGAAKGPRQDPGGIEDEARFLRSWFERPLLTGAVSPSGPALARAMAAGVDPARPGPVVELGPGTGPVTEALVRRGVDPSRLVLIEFNPEFCALLRGRFPGARVVLGDAYALRAALADLGQEAPCAAVVSSLPLFTKPEAQRRALLADAFDLMGPGAPFVQFTYAVVSPMPLTDPDVRAQRSRRVWKNLPPAMVWTYRRGGDAAQDHDPRARPAR